MRIRVLMATMALYCTLPGCVVWEIRDEMRGVNEHLTEVKQTLDGVNASLASANQALADANTRLDEVEVGLGRIDKTNIELERLAMLASIEESLGRLDVHLASVRKTIGTIDTMIPFLDLGAEEAIIETPATAEDAPEAGAVAAAEVIDSAEAGAALPGAPAVATVAEAAEAQSAPPPAHRRDFLPGVWVQRYPDSSVALVILSDGRYLRSTSAASGAPVQDGRWTREGMDIIFTPADQPAAASTQPAPARTGTAGPAAPAAAPAGPWRMSIVSSASRMLALRSESGAIAIFGRP